MLDKLTKMTKHNKISKTFTKIKWKQAILKFKKLTKTVSGYISLSMILK